MKLESVEVKNFRALNDLYKDKKVNIHEDITLLVGKNNVGKTSFTHIFHLFLNEGKFDFEDFSLNTHKKFKKVFKDYCELNNVNEEFLEKEENHFPVIQLKLSIKYNEQDNWSKISPLITSLQVNDSIEILFSYEPKNEPMLLENLRALYEEDSTFNVIDWLQKNISDHYTHLITPYSGGEYSEKIDISTVKKVIHIHHIMAQRSLEDGHSQSNSKLSPVFRKEYKIRKSSEANYQQDALNSNVLALETAITNRNKEIDTELEGFFEEFINSFSTFGFPNVEGANLTLKSHIEATDVFKGIQFFYKSNEHLLPEKYNGLGFSNLIYIISDLLSFKNRADIKAAELNLIFIEEPEAHMHPQLQSVFIKKLNSFLSNNSINAQVIISTHSSSIVSSSKFQNIKYFSKTRNEVIVKDLARFKIQLEGESKDVKENQIFKFLEQYITLVNCEMFFADKIIMIEGSVERLLMPIFIKKVDKTIIDTKKLSEQYISVIEVGGAYMHRFKEFLEFIGVKTLIITDIDCCEPQHSEKANRKVNVKHEVIEEKAHELVTTNPVLKFWIPEKEVIKELLEITFNLDEKSNFNITYQNIVSISGVDKSKCGRSFEEAFIIENAEFLLKNSTKLDSIKNKIKDYKNEVELILDSYEIYDFIDRNDKKTDFAFDLMINEEDWVVPAYIKEGLKWLAK
ncbi:AAA family ATPase [Priestia megaterium]|uniref:ATP-dependent nuclease n=1 Tax=Priestia megaterium TaxID=1404 RepID=UPI00234F2E87|nr:AAA family ATPase [Priestia megaterium]MDC7724448.1 AAA family ATPase [Priestia megaterium]